MSSRLRKLQTSRFDAMMLIRASTLFAVSFGLLVYGVCADSPCKRTDQIHWTATEGKKYKCLECPDCPAGLQSSVPCGSSVPYGTPIHCIPCQLGKTYSDKYGKSQCEACTVCSKGKAVKKNCTLFSNTECDDKCAEGYYPAPFIFDCFVCTECCNDGKDEMAKECAKFGNKCKVRSVPCTNKPAKSSETTTASQKLSSMHTPETSATFHTTQPWRLAIEMTTMLRKHLSKTPTSSLSSTAWSASNRQVEEDKTGERNSENKTLISLTTVFALIAMLSILGLIAFQIVQRKRTNLHSNDVARIEPPSQLGRAASASQEQLNPADMNLETLENSHQELFDWMCVKLDNGRRWFRRDYERLAAKYEKISLEERNSLHDELHRRGSPSHMLMSLLQTKYPSLTLDYFVMKLKEIGRNDIAQKLTPLCQ